MVAVSFFGLPLPAEPPLPRTTLTLTAHASPTASEVTVTSRTSSSDDDDVSSRTSRALRCVVSGTYLNACVSSHASQPSSGSAEGSEGAAAALGSFARGPAATSLNPADVVAAWTANASTSAAWRQRGRDARSTARVAAGVAIGEEDTEGARRRARELLRRRLGARRALGCGRCGPKVTNVVVATKLSTTRRPAPPRNQSQTGFAVDARGRDRPRIPSVAPRAHSETRGLTDATPTRAHRAGYLTHRRFVTPPRVPPRIRARPHPPGSV